MIVIKKSYRDHKKMPWVLTVITMGVKLAKAPRVQQLALVELGTAVYLSCCSFVIDWKFEQATHVESEILIKSFNNNKYLLILLKRTCQWCNTDQARADGAASRHDNTARPSHRERA